MEVVELSRQVRLIPGAVNVGLVLTSQGVVAVDTGLDKQYAKKILKFAEEIGQPLSAIVNTHAHADHFGGNAHLLSRFDAVVYAPKDESPVIRRPLFEPEYLWQGARPFAALQNKFLLAEASPVHVELEPSQTFTIGDTVFECFPLPGHAHGQIGVRVDGVCFAADSYFDPVVVDKHGLPYMVDFERTLASAASLIQIPADRYVPGHGVPTDNPRSAVDYLVDRHQRAFEAVVGIVRDTRCTLDALVQQMCRRFQLAPDNPGSYLLLRTTVAAYVTEGVRQGIIDVEAVDGSLLLSAQK
jgi:glyoxylase-like metal-dependent hydrolase (beta-lactamase superfamily II)